MSRFSELIARWDASVCQSGQREIGDEMAAVLAELDGTGGDDPSVMDGDAVVAKLGSLMAIYAAWQQPYINRALDLGVSVEDLAALISTVTGSEMTITMNHEAKA